ncbi:Subtilisin-like protease [Triticum urartu]|uniref:Subtilisin-like protease n=1 Tax=Triticum urartu TaxID=4572 RepID=M7YLJ0_TRIUA|nr:Subtilisin-like protease [Triticum urartu]
MARVAGQWKKRYKQLYLFKEISAIGLQIDDSLFPALEQLPGVLAVIPDRLHKVQTTHSWEFLGLESGGEPKNEWKYDAKFGEGGVIGNVDTADAVFGNSTVKGRSLSASTLPAGQPYPMISGQDASAADQSIDNSGANGRVEKGLVVKQASGVGMVLCNGAGGAVDIIADPHLVPAAHCSYSQCEDLLKYLQSTEFPVGYITARDELGVKPAPVMADFSSRGPNTITPQILKPDVTAPGVDVIAAYSEEVPATDLPFDDRRVPYNMVSGTSMSCPHVAGIAGLIKAKHPDWSPAMIKSAIMTTASTGGNDDGQIRDETGAAATPFSYGSGHVNPVRALDPGLVYDTTPYDYANFLCSVRPTQTQSLTPLSIPLLLPLFVGANANPFRCSLGAYRPEDLNYPSISAACLSRPGNTTVNRTRPSPRLASPAPAPPR